MISVWLQTLKGYRTPVLLVGFGLYGFALLLAYVFQAFGGLEGLGQLVDLVPETMRALLQAQGGLATSVNGWLAGGYRHPVFLVAISAFMIGTSSRVVAGEVERGTILLLLARPLVRWHFLLGKTGAILLGLSVILVLSWAGTWTGVLIIGEAEPVDGAVLLRVMFNALALGLAIGGYTTLVSSVSSDGGQTTGQAAGITVVMFFIDYLAILWSPASFLRPLSIFHYYSPADIPDVGGTPWLDLGVLFGVAAITYAAAFILFQRRDISR